MSHESERPPASPRQAETFASQAEVDWLATTVAERALEKIQQRAKWPLILVGVFATYTGYNVWSDINTRITAFQTSADQKLAEIDRHANARLDAELQRVLDTRKADISLLTDQPRSENAQAIVNAERARMASQESADEIQREADATIAEVKTRASETIAALEERRREVDERSRVVIQSIEIAGRISESNRELIESDPGRAARGLRNQVALAAIGVSRALREIPKPVPVKVAVLATGVTVSPPTPDGDTLTGRIVDGRSFVGQALDDLQGHGTQVASLVAAIAPSAEIIPVKVLSNSGSGTTTSILAGLNYAMEQGARIVILPVGGGGPQDPAYGAVFSGIL